MMDTFNDALIGATAMAALTAALIFLRFWRRSRDPLFLLFSIAFGIDAVMRFMLALTPESTEDQPLYYLPRLVAFALIIVAIAYKNTRRST